MSCSSSHSCREPERSNLETGKKDQGIHRIQFGVRRNDRSHRERVEDKEVGGFNGAPKDGSHTRSDPVTGSGCNIAQGRRSLWWKLVDGQAREIG